MVYDLVAQFLIWSQGFAITWGYLGVFLVSLLGNASIIFPIPSFLVVFAVGSVLNPWLVGIVAGLGATLGELTGYVLGFGGRHVIKRKYRKYSKDLERVKKWAEDHGMFSVLVLFAATPLPDDIVGIIGGMIRYDIKRFFLAVFIGKAILHIGIAFGGLYGGWVFGGWAGILSLVILFFFLIVVYNLVYRVYKELREKEKKKKP
ncbi:MAG: VTT domain-containing protein [Candidatus Aenigmatarchaeota archaeon]|nr:MAG: VTT domain-containing protein [Candidatus Aenigmarchaeota archaeon]